MLFAVIECRPVRQGKTAAFHLFCHLIAELGACDLRQRGKDVDVRRQRAAIDAAF